MANHKIVVDPFDPRSIENAEKEYKRLLSEFNRKVDIFLNRIAESAAKVAQAAYGQGVSVTVQGIGDGFAVVANGEAVVFLEFGAGILTDPNDPFVQEVPFPVYAGSYSEFAGTKEFYTTGRWHFGGREYRYIVPKNAMQKAYESVAQSFSQIAKEVFG